MIKFYTNERRDTVAQFDDSGSVYFPDMIEITRQEADEIAKGAGFETDTATDPEGRLLYWTPSRGAIEEAD